MIKSYGLSYTDRYSAPYLSDNDRKEYYEVCNNADVNSKIVMQLAKYNVWKVEINSIKRLRESNRISEMERLLLEDHQNLLQNEAWECGMKIYSLYKDEPPLNFIKENKISGKIGSIDINLEKPIAERNISYERYHTYSYLDKIRLRIAQHHMLKMEQYALERRYKSRKIHTLEYVYLEFRGSILSECIDLNSKYIMHIFYKEIPRDSPELKESYEEIVRARLVFKYESDWEHINDFEYYRYPYDFERPDKVSPIDWISPKNDWKTGY
jgi:hypothetical protein